MLLKFLKPQKYTDIVDNMNKKDFVKKAVEDIWEREQNRIDSDENIIDIEENE